jgi:hypothetical protein
VEHKSGNVAFAASSQSMKLKRILRGFLTDTLDEASQDHGNRIRFGLVADAEPQLEEEAYGKDECKSGIAGDTGQVSIECGLYRARGRHFCTVFVGVVGGRHDGRRLNKCSMRRDIEKLRILH